MPDIKYRQPYDRRTKWITAISLITIIGTLAYLYFSSGATYFPGWFTMLIIALVALLALSIPRFIKISPTNIEIHCVMELSAISIAEVASVKSASSSEMKWCIPIPMFGIYGLFGYYGYYFDLRNMKLIKLYCSEWRNFVIIEDIYEDIIVISCPDTSRFIADIGTLKSKL